MITQPFPRIIEFEIEGDLPPSQQEPKPFTLSQLRMEQELRIRGCSDQEIQSALKAQELTEEEQLFGLREAVKEHKKELRAYQRNQRKLKEENMALAILRKRGLGA